VPYSIYLLLAKLERIEMALQACPNYSLITEVADKSWIITAITMARILDYRVEAGSRWLNIIKQIDSRYPLRRDYTGRGKPSTEAHDWEPDQS
jgi:hypothetical protein